MQKSHKKDFQKVTTTQIVIKATRILNHSFLKAHCISFQTNTQTVLLLVYFQTSIIFANMPFLTPMCFAFLCKWIKMPRFTALNNFNDYF
jgi:hypothetical protein